MEPADIATLAPGVCKPLANGGAIAVSVGQTSSFQGRRVGAAPQAA